MSEMLPLHKCGEETDKQEKTEWEILIYKVFKIHTNYMTTIRRIRPHVRYDWSMSKIKMLDFLFINSLKTEIINVSF